MATDLNGKALSKQIRGELAVEAEAFIAETGVHPCLATVLVGDPGRAYLPESGLGLLGVYDVPTSRELEDSDIRSTSIWRLEG